MDVDRNNNANRAFLQGFMSRGTLTFKEAKPMIAAIFSAQDPSEEPFSPDDVTEHHFLSFIATASEAIAPYDYQIKHTQHQTTQERVYAILNLVDDAVTQLATTRTAEELSYIKRLLRAMFETNNTKRVELMAVNATDALNLRKAPQQQHQDEGGEDGQVQRNTDKGLRMEGAESLLKSLVEEGWLEKTEKRNYILSPRCIMELRRWLIESFNDPDADPEEWQRIKLCHACKEIVTIGLRCSDPDCNLRLHDFCAKTLFQATKVPKCPECRGLWTGDNFVGERALGRDRAVRQSGGAGRANGAGAGRRSQAAAATEEQGGDPEDDDTDSDI